MRLIGLPPSRRVWFFDLDNTLHDAHARTFPTTSAQINAYLMRRYGVENPYEQLKELTPAQRRLRNKLWTEIKASR